MLKQLRQFQRKAKTTLPVLIEVAKGKDAVLRRSAIDIFRTGGLDTKEVLSLLRGALKDSDDGVRSIAVASLVALDSRSPDSVRVLIAALADKEFLHRSLELNARTLRRLTNTLDELGLPAVPSEANFVLVPLETRQAARDLVEQLLRRGVIIRPMEAWGLPQCVRISTGTDEDLDMLFHALKEVAQAVLPPVR